MLISVFLITGSNCNNDWTYSRGKGGGKGRRGSGREGDGGRELYFSYVFFSSGQ